MITALNSEDYVNNIHKDLINQDRDSKYWGFIPVRYSLLSPLYNIYTKGSKFLDLGCGNGNVLRYAKNIGYDVTGVEIDKSFEKYLTDYNYVINNIELLDNDFYKNFDIIYSYIPIKEGKCNYINKLVNCMKVGAYLVTPHTRVKDERLECIDMFVYKKTTK